MNYERWEMYDDLDYMMAPVLAGMCRYESLLDGSLGLLDIATMNDALTVRCENDWRAQKADPQ